MFCVNCGTELPDGANFCFNCGQRVQAFISQPQEETFEYSDLTSYEYDSIEEYCVYKDYDERKVFLLHKGGLLGLVSGLDVLPCKYDSIEPANPRGFWLRSFGRLGFANNYLKVELPCEYENCWVYDDSILGLKDGMWHLFDRDNLKKIASTYGEIEELRSGRNRLYSIKKDNKFGFILYDRKEEKSFVSDIVYDEIKEGFTDTICNVKSCGKFGIMSINGTSSGIIFDEIIKYDWGGVLRVRYRGRNIGLKCENRRIWSPEISGLNVTY